MSRSDIKKSASYDADFFMSAVYGFAVRDAPQAVAPYGATAEAAPALRGRLPRAKGARRGAKGGAPDKRSDVLRCDPRGRIARWSGPLCAVCVVIAIDLR